LRKVIALDPRTPHQPEKLSNCQRTIVFYTFYIFGQQKKQICMGFKFNRVQPVHRGVQRELCKREFGFFWATSTGQGFPRFTCVSCDVSGVFAQGKIEIAAVKIPRDSVLGAACGVFRLTLTSTDV
jgi:hypothetical protein